MGDSLGELIMAFDRSNRFKDEDGRLHIRVTNISKATVNPYRGSEIPGYQALGLEPGRIYQLLRDPAELAKAAPTFNNIQLLSVHKAVNAADPQERLVAGSTGTDARFESPYLVNSLVVWRQEDIDDVESREKCQLSCAYYYDADMTPGTFESMRFDGVMRNIRGNHVALVEAGRAGPDVMVHDSRENVMPTPLASRKALIVKGALSAFLKPKLMAGTVLALDSALGSVNRMNWKTQKPAVLAAVTTMATPKLAQDQTLDDLKLALDRMDDDDDEGAEDEIEAMDEDDAAEEREAREKEDKDGASAKDRAKGAKDRKAARDAKRAKDAKPRGRDKKAADAEPEGETEEERKKREAADKAKDAKAMDAALAQNSKDTEQRVVARLTAATEAREIVRPLIGSVSIAMDSADAIYRLALDHHKIDVTGVDPSAFKAMVRMIPLPGTRRDHLAMDAAPAASLHTRFPALSRINQA